MQMAPPRRMRPTYARFYRYFMTIEANGTYTTVYQFVVTASLGEQ
jgi:hypothetical protein